MLTHGFQLILIFSAATIVVLLAAYAVYCRNRARSFVNTGRLTDIEIWSMKATISWVATFILALAAITPFLFD